MKAPKIELLNGPQVEGALRSLGTAAADVSAPTRTVLAVGLDAAQGHAPVRTGVLRAGIVIADVTPQGGALGAQAPYSPYQEYGTRHVRARRFMRAGADAIERAAPDAYRRDLAEKVSTAATKA
jgi:hypothetical protein